MAWTELATGIVDRTMRERAVRHLRAAGVVLPTFGELAAPARIPASVAARLGEVDADAAEPANLFRVHWYNDRRRKGMAPVPVHLELPAALTGVKARIFLVLGRTFPMIAAHKVLAAYGCLVPRLVTGQFDPAAHKAVWPSTGNYCRGGVAISRILGCRGVAVLPAGMSQERFDWLKAWVREREDIVRTPGTESNVKEIYDKCAELARDSSNVILNQFSEFGNHLIHYAATGPALRAVYEHARQGHPALRLAAFVAASGSAGTLGAGDYLKAACGAKIAAVEALECPTMLENGFGEHNIQGIGDKHIPFIHNVMNNDIVVGISDRSTDSLNLLFNSEVGQRYLERHRKLDRQLVAELDALGLSSIANLLAAIKVAKRLSLGPDDAVVSVATDSAAMYGSERRKFEARHYAEGFAEIHAGEVAGRHLDGLSDDHLIELGESERKRIFNLGYYTWVEQQGVPLADFERRRGQGFWQGLKDALPKWDALIEDFNRETGLNRAA
ncbi:MAG TPA: pyridoxal-phosphate dependent enzyme [Alphaproteobacteria bacterium]|nr:pyridoxal-phosphate dependent enzyme [Alphaproteobacteria bacterium]